MPESIGTWSRMMDPLPRPAKVEAPKFKSWQERRAYETGAAQAPEKWKWLPIEPKFKDYYSVPTMQTFVQAARKNLVDPNLLLALGVAESRLGNANPTNPLRLYSKSLEDKVFAALDKDESLEPRDVSIDVGAEYLADQLRKYPDELSGVQAYSGTGKTLYQGDKKKMQEFYNSTNFFGKPVEQTNFWKEKPQGKRVLGIRDQLKANPEVAALIEQVALSEFLPSHGKIKAKSAEKALKDAFGLLVEEED
jgi:hypothetical protein